jgi:hypothetical protein
LFNRHSPFEIYKFSDAEDEVNQLLYDGWNIVYYTHCGDVESNSCKAWIVEQNEVLVSIPGANWCSLNKGKVIDAIDDIEQSTKQRQVDITAFKSNKMQHIRYILLKFPSNVLLTNAPFLKVGTISCQLPVLAAIIPSKIGKFVCHTARISWRVAIEDEEPRRFAFKEYIEDDCFNTAIQLLDLSDDEGAKSDEEMGFPSDPDLPISAAKKG